MSAQRHRGEARTSSPDLRDETAQARSEEPLVSNWIDGPSSPLPWTLERLPPANIWTLRMASLITPRPDRRISGLRDGSLRAKVACGAVGRARAFGSSSGRRSLAVVRLRGLAGAIRGCTRSRLESVRIFSAELPREKAMVVLRIRRALHRLRPASANSESSSSFAAPFVPPRTRGATNTTAPGRASPHAASALFLALRQPAASADFTNGSLGYRITAMTISRYSTNSEENLLSA